MSGKTYTQDVEESSQYIEKRDFVASRTRLGGSSHEAAAGRCAGCPGTVLAEEVNGGKIYRLLMSMQIYLSRFLAGFLVSWSSAEKVPTLQRHDPAARLINPFPADTAAVDHLEQHFDGLWRHIRII